MSGSPIYTHDGPQYGLLGIAVGNQESHLAVRESLHLQPDEGRSVYRITEYGLALRLSAQVRWHKLAGGATLHDLVQPPRDAVADT